MTVHELAKREPAEPAAVDINTAVLDLTNWAQAAKAAYDVATQLCQTSFVPKSFRDRPHEACAAILSGLEVGLSPMAALRSFDVIDGTAAPRAATLRAIVQSHGHRIWVHESTSTRAIVRGIRLGESVPQEAKWDMDRAKLFGLAGKKNWVQQPTAMLIARATAECCRLIASDAIHGIAYTVEELTDGPVEVEQVEAPRGKVVRRTARRRPIVDRPLPEPELEPPPQTDTGAAAPPPGQESDPSAEPHRPTTPAAEQTDDPASVSPQMISEPQKRMMHASFRDLGITDRQERLDFAATVLDRPIESSTELTMHDASLVIDALERALRDLHPGEEES